MAVVVGCFYAALFLFTFHEADEDLWGRLAVGRLVAETGAAPREDPFAYVPTKPLWVDHEWLSGVVFYQLHRLLGDPGLVLLRAATGLAAVWLAWHVARREGARSFAIGLVALAVSPLLLQGYNSVVRAQSFSLLLFALVPVLARAKGAYPWALVPLFALSANLHGGFVAGLLLLAILRPAVALAAALASLVNPYGIRYWGYLASALPMARPGIAEWKPGYPDLHVQIGAAVVVAALVAGRSLDRRHLVILAGTLGAALLHVRFAPFLGLAAIASLPIAVEAAFKRRRAPHALALMLLLQASALVGILVGYGARALNLAIAVPETRYPVRAVSRLEASGASGDIAVYFNWGEYVLYRLHPRFRVSIDGRYETVYPDEIATMNRELANGTSDRLLTSYPPDFALYPQRSGAAEILARSHDFELILGDDNAVLYETVEDSRPIR